MASIYTAALPPGWILARVRDQEYKGLEAGMPRADVRHVDAAATTITWAYLDDRVVPPAIVTAWQAAIANPAPAALAPWVVRDAQEQQITNQLQTLRDYLALAAPTAAQRLAMEKALIRAVLNVVRRSRNDAAGTD